MNQAMKYLDILQEREPQLFKQPLQKSSLTDKDIEEIEQELGHTLPTSYKEFLKCYKMPREIMVHFSFCGDYAANFEDTFSREENGFVECRDEDLCVTQEIEWHNAFGDTGKEFIENLKEQDVELSEDFNALDLGLIYIAEFCGNFAFLDLVTGKIVYIYHEEIYELEIVYEVDTSSKEEIRDFLLDEEFCHDFYDFLRLVCAGDVFDDNTLTFKTEEELREEQG